MFFSSDWALLTLLAECFMVYLHPLQWQHTFVPILSGQMLDFIMAPTSFLMGCHLDHFEEVSKVRGPSRGVGPGLRGRRALRGKLSPRRICAGAPRSPTPAPYPAVTSGCRTCADTHTLTHIHTLCTVLWALTHTPLFSPPTTDHRMCPRPRPVLPASPPRF